MSATPYMRTFTGIFYNPLKPNLLHIEIDDIAHGLVNNSRYAGQSRIRIPIAAHCLAMVDVMSQLSCSPASLYAALNHDDSEAYMQDLAAPLKHQVGLAGFRRIEDRNMKAISKRFGFAYPGPPEVKVWDTWSRRVEQAMYMRGHEWKNIEAEGLSVYETKRAGTTLHDTIKYCCETASPEELKRTFIEKFYNLRTAACFNPEISKEGFAQK